MSKINSLTDTLIKYPKHQFRYYLHRFCYDSKINYWLRTQLPYHGNRFVDGFREQQMRLVASYIVFNVISKEVCLAKANVGFGPF